jgi:hypothetical protein
MCRFQALAKLLTGWISHTIAGFMPSGPGPTISTTSNEPDPPAMRQRLLRYAAAQCQSPMP